MILHKKGLVNLMTQQLEKRLVNEYFSEHFLDKHVQRRVALGPTSVLMVNKELGVVTRWADAIVFDSDRVTIIEFKMEPKPDAVGQLLEYEKLFRQTLGFQNYWKLPIYNVLVTTRVDEHLKELAEEHGIEYQVFRPAWIEFWEKRRFRL